MTSRACSPEIDGDESTYLEDSRRVVVDGVDTRTILPEEEHASQEQTPHQVRALSKCLEGLPEPNTHGGLLSFVGLVNSRNFFGDVDIGSGQLTDPAEILHSIAAALMEEQPPRRFPDPQGTHEQQTRRNQLNGKGNNPLLAVWRHVLLDTILQKNKTVSMHEGGDQKRKF